MTDVTFVCLFVCLSVCMYVCHLSHSCTLLMLLDGMRPFGRDTRVVPGNVVLDGAPGLPTGRRNWWLKRPLLQCCRPWPNYFGCGPCLLSVRPWLGTFPAASVGAYFSYMHTHTRSAITVRLSSMQKLT